MSLVMAVKRKWFTDKSTIGEMWINGDLECFTLEDTVRRGMKIYGETAIPEGRYQVILQHSPRFNRLTPTLLNVEGFSYVRIHPGNTYRDTDGCILVGQIYDRATPNVIGKSRLAYDSLFSKIKEAIDKDDEVYIDLRNTGR